MYRIDIALREREGENLLYCFARYFTLWLTLKISGSTRNSHMHTYFIHNAAAKTGASIRWLVTWYHTHTHTFWLTTVTTTKAWKQVAWSVGRSVARSVKTDIVALLERMKYFIYFPPQQRKPFVISRTLRNQRTFDRSLPEPVHARWRRYEADFRLSQLSAPSNDWLKWTNLLQSGESFRRYENLGRVVQAINPITDMVTFVRALDVPPSIPVPRHAFQQPQVKMEPCMHWMNKWTNGRYLNFAVCQRESSWRRRDYHWSGFAGTSCNLLF